MKNGFKYRFFLLVQYMVYSVVFDVFPFSRIKNRILGCFIEIGHGSTIASRTLLKCEDCSHSRLSIGENVEVASGVLIDFTGGLHIQDEVWISEGASIFTHSHVSASKALKRHQRMKRIPLEIGKDAWIGSRAIIYPRVRKIGTGAIIGAGSVVYEDVQDWQVVFGNPAVPISSRISPPDGLPE